VGGGFWVAQTKAYKELQPATTDSIQAKLAFIASAQDLKTPGCKGNSSKDSNKNLSLSPFLLDQDLTQRDEWRENAFVPKGLAEHVKKLGDVMNFVMSMVESQEHKEEDFYTDVVEDLAKIKACQIMTTDARIGQTLPILEREFPNLWAALHYSVHQEEVAITSSIAKLQQEMLEATKREEEIKKQLKDWLIDVVQSFENVKAHFGAPEIYQGSEGNEI
jgi:hypothetical protein